MQLSQLRFLAVEFAYKLSEVQEPLTKLLRFNFWLLITGLLILAALVKSLLLYKLSHGEVFLAKLLNVPCAVILGVFIHLFFLGLLGCELYEGRVFLQILIKLRVSYLFPL